MFWYSGRVIDCNILILFSHSTTGPEHPIYRTTRTVWKTWITIKMLCPQVSNFVYIKGLAFCILSIPEHKQKMLSIFFFRKNHIFWHSSGAVASITQPKEILKSRYTAGFISDNNSWWIFSELNYIVLTKILPFLTDWNTTLWTRWLQTPRNDCAVRIQ